MKFVPGLRARKLSNRERHRSFRMKAFRGWAITAGLVLASAAANAQSAPPQQAGPARYQAASDIEGPYADAPPPLPRAPAYGPPAAYGPPPAYRAGPAEYGPAYGAPLLPPTEVYAVLRENGFSPLGAPRLRGLFYSISAIDRRGGDGRLVIDAHDGRIVRFVPAEHLGGYGGGYGGYGDSYYGGAPRPSYGYGPIEPMTRLDGTRLDGAPRPPAAVPKIASRMPQQVPMPRPAPAKSTERLTDVKPLADKLTPAPAPAPMQQSAAVQAKPVDTPPAALPAVAATEAKPATVIQSTQPMPKVQGLE
jgi:hypothetical protein